MYGNKGLSLFSLDLTLFLSIIARRFCSVLAPPTFWVKKIRAACQHAATCCLDLICHSSYQFLMALSSLAVYGVLLAGWASYSKYALLGSLRSVALMVPYKLGFGAVLSNLQAHTPHDS